MHPSTSPSSNFATNAGDSSAAELCHDLDNVLLSIDSHARALRAAGAARISDGAERHLDAIESGLDFLRRRSLRARESIRRRRPTSVSLRLDEWWLSIDHLARAALPPPASLHASFPRSLAPLGIEADELTACVLHLIVNAGQALSHVRAGGRVDIDGIAAGDGFVLVRVADNGPGMSSETIGRAGSAGFTTRAGGTGMGLHAVRECVTRVGGSVIMHSTPGRGAVVELRLPAAEGLRSRRA